MKTQNFLVDVEPQYYFYVCNGTVLKNLTDLQILLQHIDNGTFSYHVNSGKNDFFNWIRDIVKDNILAKKIADARTKEAALKYLNERISSLGGKVIIKNRARTKKAFKPITNIIRGKKDIISQLKKSV
jgi:hypothetical protein